MKNLIKSLPVIGGLLVNLKRLVDRVGFKGSGNYWNNRYKKCGNSGPGSYGNLAIFKAQILNQFVSENNIESVIEFGCGDGNQLRFANYPKYTGFDVSDWALRICRTQFKNDKTKEFLSMEDYSTQTAELTLSLDVIYHLVEDDVFESYMRTLFSASRKYVVIYSSNTDNNEGNTSPHVRNRMFTMWVEKKLLDWKLVSHIKNKYPYTGDPQEGSISDFFIYERI